MENTNHCCNLNLLFEDHLHIRGEYFINPDKKVTFKGSPPHTWRIPAKNPTSTAYGRITSTYVENTIIFNSWLKANWDHLHIRGEYFQALDRCTLDLGSPPHTWRIPNESIQDSSVDGITSTYVENTKQCHCRRLLS